VRLVRIANLIGTRVSDPPSYLQQVEQDIADGIREVCWPPGADSFILCDEEQGNGVKPIKLDFVEHLRSKGWLIERRMQLASHMRPGKVDAVLPLLDGRHFAVEWETGNISSSHRALNKMAVGLLDGCLAGGALILPSRQMYRYLTDRVGNYDEIEPYFPMWRALPLPPTAVLDVYVVEHDDVLRDVLPIPKGTDGRARR
jgi:hypothetical protein